MMREGALGVFAASLLASLGLASGCSEDSAGDGDTVASGGATGGGSASSGGRSTGGSRASTGGSGGNAGSLPDGTTGEAPECRNSKPLLGLDGKTTGYATCEGGSLHRPSVLACPTTIPRAAACQPYVTGFDAGRGGCVTDSDCTVGPHDWCGVSSGMATCTCHHGCRTDDDCDAGSICVCGSPVGQCVSATCTSDADCGDGLLCLSYEYGCGRAFACQTPDDTCVANADCKSGLCDVVDGVHTCRPQSCVDGRPFLVGGAARVAALTSTSAWTSTACPSLESLGDADRTVIGMRWTEVALMEHASVAAFARFALELLSFGAPPELLLATQSAMSDEIAHARSAFALAGAYLGRPQGPGALDVSDALGARTPIDIVQSTILEGCIGETVAALEATEALAHATDPAVRAALESVVAEETRHAELAYRFVQWVLVHGDAQLAHATRTALVTLSGVEAAAAARDASAGPAPALNAVHAAHGVLDEGTRAALKARVLASVVVPCARALADSSRVSPNRSRLSDVSIEGAAA